MKLNVKSAEKGLYHHSYSPLSVLSLDFSDLQPTLRIDAVPTDKWKKAHGEGSMLLAPQIFPAYGKLYVKNATFFVPESQLVEYAEAFHNNNSSWKGKSVKRPMIYNTTINQMFYTYRATGSQDPEDHLCSEVASGTVPATVISSNNLTDDDYEFCYVDGATGQPATYHFMHLSRKGKKMFKILKALGYDFPSYGYFPGNTVDDILNGTQDEIDALPIFAYAKIFIDYFLSGQLFNNSTLVAFLRSVHCGDTSYSTYYAANRLTAQGLYFILNYISVPYEKNMYTEAWNSPNSPLGLNPDSEMISSNPDGLISPYRFVLSDGNQNTVITSSPDDALLRTLSSTGIQQNISLLSHFGQNALNVIYKFVKRNHLAGSNSIDRFFARFGIKNPDYDNGRVRKLSEGSNRVVFHPIYSNADTETTGSSDGKTLGSFSGMAYSGLNIEFNYNSSEYGYIINVAWINIVPIKLRGFDPSVLRKFPYDFWTPEYDGKAMRAIPYCEVSTNQRSTDNLVSLGEKKIYGFTNLYQEYRQLGDVIAGDFVFGKNTKYFAFTRDFSVFRKSGYGSFNPQDIKIQMQSFLHSEDLSDPFQMSNKLGDRFYLFIDWSIDAERPILSDSDALDLNGSGDLSLDVNGSKMA